MSDCCESKALPKFNKKEPCPNCTEVQNITSYQTVLHHVLQPYKKNLNEDGGYYFCKNSQCDVVYFDTENAIIVQADVRQKVGQKDPSATRKICYCFDVTYDQVAREIEEKGISEIKDFVKSQTKLKNCACEIRNPAGRCCLVDFPKG